MRGKKTSPEVVYQVLTSYAITNNLSETSRTVGLPLGTVKDIVDKYSETDEYQEVRNQKREEFAEKASAIIDKLLTRIENTVADDEKDIPLHHLTTAMGTLFDKRALSRGEMTQNINFATNSETFDKLASLSGYGKIEEKAENDDEQG